MRWRNSSSVRRAQQKRVRRAGKALPCRRRYRVLAFYLSVGAIRAARCFFFFKQKTAYEMGHVTGVQTCALPILAEEVERREVAGEWQMDQWFSIINYRSEEHTSELQSRGHLVCRLLLEKKK